MTSFSVFVQGCTNLVVFIELRVGLQKVRVELRLRVCGLDNRDSDTPRAQLMIERFRIAFDGVLGRRIERPVWHRQETQHRADVDDAATPLASHVGHHGTRHPDYPEKVRIEDRPGLFDGALFRSGGGDTEASVVHEHIDATFHAHQFAHGGASVTDASDINYLGSLPRVYISLPVHRSQQSERVMRKTQRFILVAAIGSAWLLTSCAATSATSSSAVEAARITVLYDAFGKNSAMTNDWGYAALVEINGKRILFDTGNDPAIFAKNVKAKGVDLTKLDFVVLSHRHGDHVSGVSYLLKMNPKVTIYAPKDGFGGIFGSDQPSKFYRKDESLPAAQRYYGGTPPETVKLGTVFPGASIRLIDKTTELAPGITLIAQVSDASGTKELKELSLAINTADGLVLVVGCSHPGIEGIVAEAATINPHIHFIAGGFHLLVAQDPAIEKVATTLHDTYKVDYIAPGHCTGEPTFAVLQRMFGDHYLYAGLGTTLDLGASPRAASDRRATGDLDEGDLRTYRTLLAQSDDRPQTELLAQTN
jgi:7,8-dihydropterin-6-yl-methyl-4-(beta-D-ribofuranosyl)aminobenzene 5'-phosphate synthase